MAKNNSFLRTRNLFDPSASKPFSLSRSKIENFLRCPRCFYLDRRLGLGQPSMPAFTLNSAVDSLLKKEFDIFRKRREPHPLMTQYGIKAVPLDHAMMEEWQEVFKGIRYFHQPSNFIVFGAIDDIWIGEEKELYIVDYKSTSTSAQITLDGEYKEAYKRQMEIYQWLFRRNEFKVSNTGYFIYCNADKTVDHFDGKLEFDMEIIPYEGDDGWVEKAILEAKNCLMADTLPDYGNDCEYCRYRQAAFPFEERQKPTKKEVQEELF